ncbi:MAG: HNH endonuclease [Actinobacteria bacterium]|nr:HNH endonuclease [Actinomycetota bacterium]
MSVFRQSPRLGLSTRTCHYCSAPAEPGTRTCSKHAGEAGRLAADPRRAGYRDPAYHRARRAAIRRSGGRCEACGKQLQHQADGRLICQAHHIDGDPRNNSPSNLLICCPGCHSGSRRPS